MANFGSYSGKEIFDLEFKKKDWLVEGIVREKQSVLFAGSEKSGKSVWIKQLICSLTSQHPMHDRMNVLRPCKVTYIQLEGEIEDTKDRFTRMSKTQDINPELLQVLFLPPLGFEDESKIGWLESNIRQFHVPDVLIIDPLYFAFNGSLSDDEVVRKFIGNLRVLKERLDCAVILVHHTHKTKHDYKGNVIKEGDEAVFGSKFLKAYPDHILLFTYDKRSNTRILSCETQRSGDIVKEARLQLIEPDPLYFQEVNMNPTKEMAILAFLQDSLYVDGLTAEEIMEKTKIGSSTFYRSMKRLLGEGLVIKTRERPTRFHIKKEKS